MCRALNRYLVLIPARGMQQLDIKVGFHFLFAYDRLVAVFSIPATIAKKKAAFNHSTNSDLSSNGT